jgi:hypothetical protein
MLLAKNIYTNRPTKKMDYRFLSLFAITEKIGIGIFRLYLIFIYQRFHSVFYIFFFKVLPPQNRRRAAIPISN